MKSQNRRQHGEFGKAETGNPRDSRIIASAFKVFLKMSQEIVNFYSLSDDLKQANILA